MGARHFLIVPADSGEFAIHPRTIRVNTTGTAVVVTDNGAGGETAISYNVTQGDYIILRAKRINATGTTAQLIGSF